MSDSGEPRAPKRRWLALDAGASNWLWLSIVVLVLDQWTKQLVMSNFREFDEITLLPVLDFMRLHNEGAAFSFLSTASGWQRWFFVALGIGVGLAILIWLRRLPRRGQGLVAAGLALVLGGALGNVVDRVFLGYVVDFIRVHYEQWYFPAFNVADSAITIGAGLLILDALMQYLRELDGRKGTGREAAGDSSALSAEPEKTDGRGESSGESAGPNDSQQGTRKGDGEGS
jgi:signal peptidase II